MLRNFGRQKASSSPSIPNCIFQNRNISRCQGGYDTPFIEDAWPCEYLYNGQGIEYQILAGPVFVVVGTVSALVFGALSDKFNRWEGGIR